MSDEQQPALVSPVNPPAGTEPSGDQPTAEMEGAGQPVETVREFGSPKTEDVGRRYREAGGGPKASEAAAETIAEIVRAEAAIAAKAIALAREAADALQFHSDALENGVPDKRRRQVCQEQKKLIKALRAL